MEYEWEPRKRILTDAEREQVRAWRAVASRYRHGDCGRESHREIGCDIVCLYIHSELTPEEAGSEFLRRPPWEAAYRRPTLKESNAVTILMDRLVMHAVPRPEPVQPCDGKAAHPAAACRACAVESERQMYLAIQAQTRRA